MDISVCRLIDLTTVQDARGNLTAVEAGNQVPFEIQCVFYIYGVPPGLERGGHAHNELEELVVATSGSFDVVLDDGREKRVVHLSRPSEGLYIYPTIWRELKNFSEGAVCLALASHKYDEADYLRDYRAYTRTQRERTRPAI